MSWVRVDDAMPDHPKLAGPDWSHLFALQMTATCFCSKYLTDGFLRASIIPDLLRRLPPDRDWVAAMLEAGLWEETKGGYLVHDYFEYNPTKEQVLADRKANAERQQSYRQRNDNAVTSPPNITPARLVPPSRPVPSPATTTTAKAAAPPEKPRKQPTALYLLYEAVKHDLWGAAGKPPERDSERRDYDGLKSLRAVWKDADIVVAAKELRRQVESGLIPDWKPGCRFGAFALRTKFDAGTWWMDKLLADARRSDQRSHEKPALKSIGDVMRKAMA